MSGNTADNYTIGAMSHKESARQRTILNTANSRLVSLPPELLKLVSYYLTDPLDLLRFSYTCHEFYYLTAPSDWYSLAVFTYKNWIKNTGRFDERDWKSIVLKDAALGVRLGASLPALPSTSSPAPSTSVTMTSSSPPSALTVFMPSPDNINDVTLSREPQPLPSVVSPSRWSTYENRLPSSLDQKNRRRPFKVLLSEAQDFPTDPETKGVVGAPWVRMGSPIYNIDRDSRSVIAASMLTRPQSVPSNPNGGDPRPHDHEILFYSLPDLTNPIARCGSDVWEKDKKTSPRPQPWYHPFTRDMMQVAQVVEIKHFPKDIVDNKMRVIVVIAFGQRARPLVNSVTDSHILGVWLMLKVIELRVPAEPQAVLSTSLMNHFRASPEVKAMSPKAAVRINPDDVVNYESLEPRQHQITMHGRIVKLYTADEPSKLFDATTGGAQDSTSMDVSRSKVDCIAIFGTQNSDVASAMVIKKVLFRDGEQFEDLGKRTYSNKAVSRGVSCMTLFPDHSGYEHLLVLFNQHGRGMVWDWIHERQITQLHMPIDDKSKNAHIRRHGDEPANTGVVFGNLATAGNPAADPGAAAAPPPRRRVYYWGVQVSSALEVSFPEGLDETSDKGTFRIVTMADGADDEWESCWWDISRDILHEPMRCLTSPPIIDRNRLPQPSTTATVPAKAPLISSVKRFESKTVGVCLPEQQKTHAEEDGQPIQFIAYVVWNHYRIGLSSHMGICMMDLEEPESEGAGDRQWITFLKDREDLIDIAIFGHNLVVTLKHGHLVWSFYGQEKIPFVPDGLGLRMQGMG
ncbi:hypothetical protein BGX29_006247 [Mortierella sp. GBA35]|nr:hypothetical protein BGX29_006247 [Mortierella sp. GBA35]